MLQLAVTTHMEVANKVVFVGSSLWHLVRTTCVQRNLRGSQASALSHTRRCTSYEGLDRGLRRFPSHTADVAGCPTLVLPLGQTRTSADVCSTTATPPIADMPGSPSDVAEGPNSDIRKRRCQAGGAWLQLYPTLRSRAAPFRCS